MFSFGGGVSGVWFVFPKTKMMPIKRLFKKGQMF
jgi:hypothetical protein